MSLFRNLILLSIAAIWPMIYTIPGEAAPAKIWLSDCLIDPGVEAPTITSVVGTPRLLHIWAQPVTNGGGFKTLDNFSLNLLADTASVDFLDPDSSTAKPITVRNPSISGTPRFEFVGDSSASGGSLRSSATAGQVSGGTKDSIDVLSGFTITPVNAGGIGPSCSTEDPFCGNDGSDDAWLLGTVWYKPINTTGAGLRLQIGVNGINHAGESSASTDVDFGNDTVSYNGATDRDTTLGGDTVVEATIAAVASATATSWSGTGSNWSSATWSGGSPSAVHDATLSPGGSTKLTVTGCQSANDTTVSSGRLHIDSTGALHSDTTVSSGGTISGGGWLTADLDNSAGGSHGIDDVETLTVLGNANVSSAVLTVTDSYTQADATITSSFEIIDAESITGTFATTAGTYLGGGIFLASIAHSSTSVSVELRNLPGDYDGDGDVDTADYSTWNSALGTTGVHAADGNLNGTVDEADYTVWLANIGSTAIVAGVGTGAISAVPEPCSFVLFFLGLMTLTVSRVGSDHPTEPSLAPNSYE